MKTVSAQASGTPITQTVSVTVGHGAVSQSVSTLAVSSGSMTACSGSCMVGSTAVTATVTVKDQFGNVFASSTVTPSATGTGNTFTPSNGITNSSGVFTSTYSSTLSSGHTVSATANFLTLTQTQNVTVNPASPASIAVNGGNNQTAHIGAAVATNPSAIVRDAFNNAVGSGISVTFSVTAGGGTVNGGSFQITSTDASGIATATSWVMQNAAGDNANGTFTNTLSASASGAGSTSFTGFGIYFLSSDVQTVLNNHCTSCHFSGGNSPILTAGSTYSQTYNVTATCDATKKRVNPTSASTSVVYLRVSSNTECSGYMPPILSQTLTSGELTIIRAWINNGAPNN